MSNETTISSSDQFSDWLTTGTTPRCVYHRGCHVRETPTGVETHDVVEARMVVKAIAARAWRSAAAREVYLVQRRVEGGVFEYIAIRAAEKVPLAFAASSEGVRAIV
jgi:hypothetical protein